MPEPLTSEQVQHVAKLARLRLNPEQLSRYGRELSSVLEYVAKLGELDVAGVEPMAHPLPLSNRLDEDVIKPGLSIEQVLVNAPATEGRHIAVPKVIDEGEGS